MSVAAEAKFGYVFKAQQQVLTPDHPDLLMSDADLGPTSATANAGKLRGGPACQAGSACVPVRLRSATEAR